MRVNKSTRELLKLSKNISWGNVKDLSTLENSFRPDIYNRFPGIDKDIKEYIKYSSLPFTVNTSPKIKYDSVVRTCAKCQNPIVDLPTGNLNPKVIVLGDHNTEDLNYGWLNSRWGFYLREALFSASVLHNCFLLNFRCSFCYAPLWVGSNLVAEITKLQPSPLVLEVMSKFSDTLVMSAMLPSMKSAYVSPENCCSPQDYGTYIRQELSGLCSHHT